MIKPNKPKNPNYKGKQKRITHEVANWQWDHDKIEKKMQKGTDDECWSWTGAKGPYGNLMGAHKNTDGQWHPQMIQVNRLLAMEQLNEDISDRAVYMRCGNIFCCNPNHFSIVAKVGTKRKDIYVGQSVNQ